MTSLKKTTVKNLMWSGVNSYSVYFFKFAFSITIARILSPSDYGLVGMMAIFIAIATNLTDSGFQSALLQKKEPVLKDYSSVFFLNLLIAFFIFLLLNLGAGQIASFYNEPRMVLISRVMSIGIVINSVGGIHQTWLIKNMKFSNITRINLISSLLAGGIGVGMAIKGYGVWALIFQTLSGNLFKTMLLWMFSKIKMPFYFSINNLKNLYSFGWKMFVQMLLQTIFRNIYYPIIGKFYNVISLGYYTNAFRMFQLTVGQTNGAISSVLFPTFSSIQDDAEKLTRALQKSVRLLLFIIFPVIAVLIITANPFVSFFLTDKWLPAVTYIQLLYLFGFISPIHSLNMNLLNGIGKSGITLKINVLNKILLIISIIVGMQFGIIGLIVGNLIVMIVTYFSTVIFLGKDISYKLKAQMKDFIPEIIIISVAFAAGWLINLLIPMHNLLLIIVQALTVIFVYYLVMKIFKPKTYQEFAQFIRPHIPSRISFLI